MMDVILPLIYCIVIVALAAYYLKNVKWSYLTGPKIYVNFVNTSYKLPDEPGKYYCRYVFKNTTDVCKGVLTYEKLNGELIFTTPTLNMTHCCETIEWLKED